MLKQIQQGLTKFFTTERVIVLAIFLVLAYGLIMYSGNKSMVIDRMTDYSSSGASNMTSSPYSHSDSHSSASSGIASVLPSLPSNLLSSSDSSASASASTGYSSHSVANPSDLLPHDNNSEWSALNPNTMSKGDMLMPDLLQAGYHIGLDTIGQTLRNANLQLRSDPIIPKTSVGPWNQSTIEPDLGRVPLEIGDGNR
jgi:hypothetical protein